MESLRNEASRGVETVGLAVKIFGFLLSLVLSPVILIGILVYKLKGCKY